MLVLFTGGRGSGKSTIAKALFKSLDYHNCNYNHQSKWRIKANSFYKKLALIIYFLTFYQKDICNVFFKRFYRDIKHGRSKGSLSRFYMPCLFSYHVKSLSKKKFPLIIYDSDFLTWGADTVYNNKFNPNEIGNYYSSIILPKVKKILIVVCDTPTEIAIERWCLRDNKTFTAQEIIEWKKKREYWKSCREKIIDIVSEIIGIHTIRLNGLEEPEKNVKKIIAELNKLKICEF